ncbi:MAG TPA: hypothetical protein VFQ85_19385 [Mycobacteriales bacterium]|jgi:hypothetical protein|nr:hypothetical protein [Mycobacteriales bacterium]
MSFRRAAAALAIAALGAFAPAAHADYPYTCDNVDCFALWCVDHLGDCRDSSPSSGFCYDRTCFAARGDVADYAMYCTLDNSPVWCVL